MNENVLEMNADSDADLGFSVTQMIQMFSEMGDIVDDEKCWVDLP